MSYSLNTQLASITTAQSLQVWINTHLLPYLTTTPNEKYTNLKDSLIIRVLKTSAKYCSDPLIQYLVHWVCGHWEYIGTCSVLWHFLEWIDSVQSMLFEPKVELPPAFKVAVKAYSIKCISESEGKWIDSLTADTVGLQLLHYLNLHLFLSESVDLQQFPECKNIFVLFANNLPVLEKLLSKKASGADIKLFCTLHNLLKLHDTMIVSPVVYGLMCGLLLNNKIFTETFTVLSRSYVVTAVPLKFAEREQSIKCSVVLNYALALLLFGTSEENYEWQKAASVYHQFFDANKEGVIRLMSISDSSLIAFLFYITSLESTAEAKGNKVFDTKWIALEYLVRLIEQYGEDGWCEMSIDYLLEDAQYLEFVVCLLNYLQTMGKETLKVRYSLVYAFIGLLLNKLATYSDKKIFPYNLHPLMSKMKAVL